MTYTAYTNITANADLDTWVPGNGRTVPDIPSYLRNNAVFNVNDYGAVGDGTTDDTVAIQAAMSAASGGMLFFPPGSYLISSPVTGVSGIYIYGPQATIKAATRISTYLSFASVSDVTIEKLAFDLGQPVLTTYVSSDYPNVYNQACYFDGSSGIKIADCHFFNLYTNALNFYNVMGKLDILGNKFTSPTQAQDLSMRHIWMLTTACVTTIKDNYFDNATPSSCATVPCAVFGSGTTGPIEIANNRFNNCGRDNTGSHRLAVIDFYGNSVDVNIHHNRSFNGWARFCRARDVARVNIHHNSLSQANGAEVGVDMVDVESNTDYVGTGQVGAQDVNIHHNVFKDGYDSTRIGVTINSYDWSTPATDIYVHHNKFHDMKYPLFIGGPWDNVRFEDNALRGANDATMRVQIQPGGVTVTGTNGVLESAAIVRDLFIRRNDATKDGTGDGSVSIDLTKTPEYSGVVGTLEVSNNTLKLATRSGGQAIAGLGPGTSTPKGMLIVRDNDIDNHTYAIYPRQWSEVVIERNKTRNILSGEVLQSGNTTIVQRDNRWGTGPSSGQVTLAGGSVTVITDEVRSDDSIQLTRVGASGALGHLSVGTITPGSSFTITSSSSSDMSTIFWEIRH